MSTTIITDLPYEIILEISEGLDDFSRQRLSQTCQKLRQITLTVITSKHLSFLQSLSDAGCLSLNDAHTVQDLLQPNLPFTPELRLTTYFHSNLFQDLTALRTLLLRLERVSLDLRLTPLESVEFGPILRPQWTKLLAEVMNLVVMKPKSHLTVGRGRNWRTLGRPFHYEFKEHPGLQPRASVTLANDHRNPSKVPVQGKQKTRFPFLIRPILRLLGEIVAKLKTPNRGAIFLASELEDENMDILERSMKSCAVSLNPPPTSQLDQFHINTPILMELPFFHWTMSIIASSPITKLSFSDIDLTHYDWSYILSTLRLPTLSHIAFGSSNIAFPDLQSFLSRHSSITTLDLSRNNAIGSLKPFSSQKLLPNLNHLIANSEYLSHFLEPPSAFPNLQSITMSAGSLGNFRTHDYERKQFEMILRRIASRKPGPNVIPSLTLYFTSEARLYGLNTWLRSIQIMVGTEIRPIIQLEPESHTIPNPNPNPNN
ncbi:hypothetical protein H0H93_011386, partial [Arthromyces matolae]